MPLSRKTATPDPDDDGDYTTEPDETEAPKRRGLGKRVTGKADAAFKKGADEARGKARDDDEDDDEDEDDDAPASGAVKSGWAAARKAKAAGGGFAKEFKFEQDETLVKFLEDEPFAVYQQHWIEGLKSTNKKSFICLGKGCPICAIGDQPRPMFAFNIAVIDEDEVDVQSLLAGTRLLGQIETAHGSKNGPLSKGFWALSRSGKKQSTAYTLQAVKPRDLADDWEVDLEVIEPELASAKGYTADQYKPMAKSALKDIADEIADDDD